MPADTEQDEGFLRGYKSRSYSAQQPRTPSPAPRPGGIRNSYNNRTTSTKVNHNSTKDEFSSSISWPIILAVIPTLGAFIAGSAEVWSDFIMILLILYYVYKWITGKSLYIHICVCTLYLIYHITFKFHGPITKVQGQDE